MTTVPSSVLAFLQHPYLITQEQIDFYEKNRYIKLKGVFNEETLQFFNPVISEQVTKMNTVNTSLENRSTYGKAFLQLFNLWQENEAIKELVFSKRLAKIASDLMQTSGARLYHDQALFKEGGGGITPWHADQYYWPLQTDKTVTAWMPLQATPLELGPLEFSAGSHQIVEGRDLEISDESEIAIQQKLKVTSFKHIIEPYEAGEVSFHSGWVFHRAGANTTNSMRKVMTVIYMDKEMTLKNPDNKNQIADWNAWCPGAEPGKIINTPLNPVLYASN
ncbi:MAG: phytanoyl-CoA dioxygenase family protein [Bacteroidetes bacterium]|nr:phytanoyl-CoA dioxygenase family protein [Bacteroidota bacterium]MBS1649038.1 phytanoyl-CoA dioxygenase family protein [Bacteroidota bacterium]